MKYLKFEQVFFRIYYRLYRPTLRPTIASLCKADGRWVSRTLYPQKLLGDNQARFLNATANIADVGIWNNHEHPLLWLYNLHYFDDLVSHHAEQRRELQQQLLNRWIDENPPGEGVGWQPYPISLRLVNVIKAVQEGLQLTPEMINNLACQAQCLAGTLERHILANHLFANGKALLFAGVALDCQHSTQWRKTATQLLLRELEEQILPDGGNYELSPMYHCIMLVDLLDMLNLAKRYPGRVDKRLSTLILNKSKTMLLWLQTMLHNDGEVSYFNDSTAGVAPSAGLIFDYAAHLFATDFLQQQPRQSLVTLEASGYSRISMPDYYILFDHAQVGPDYQPGHAHADTLSFEMGIGDQRLIVNAGISQYGTGAERHRQRSTESHSTVQVDGQNSSEVWGGFRVARRARPALIMSKQTDQGVEVQASHDGYQRLSGKVTHLRCIKAQSQQVIVTDQLQGKYASAVAYFHLHPDVKIVEIKHNSIVLTVPNQKHIAIEFTGKLSVENSQWFPEFGKSVDSQLLSVQFTTHTLTATLSIKDKL